MNFSVKKADKKILPLEAYLLLGGNRKYIIKQINYIDRLESESMRRWRSFST